MPIHRPPSTYTTPAYVPSQTNQKSHLSLINTLTLSLRLRRTTIHNMQMVIEVLNPKNQEFTFHNLMRTPPPPKSKIFRSQ